MLQRNFCSMLALASAGSRYAPSQTALKADDARFNEHTKWVGDALEKMLTVVPGQTRADLFKVFKNEGGLSTPLQRTYVSRECLLFKVDVRFHAVGRPEKDGDGRITPKEDDQDLISTISRPYLQFCVMD